MTLGDRVRIDWPGVSIFGDGRPHDYQLTGLCGSVVEAAQDACLVRIDAGPTVRIPVEHLSDAATYSQAGTIRLPDSVKCARDSDWCDGEICRERGIDCPNAGPDRDREKLVAYLRHLAALPRWRRWLWGVLPGNRFTYGLLGWLEGWEGE